MKKEPNLRQKKLAKYMSENIGVSMEKAMIDLGYSASYANSSDKIKKTKGWKYLMRKELPNSKLIKVVKEGLDANRTISIVSGKQASGGTTEFVDVPDFMARHKYLETALKMKGKLTERKDIRISELKGLVGLETTNEKEA